MTIRFITNQKPRPQILSVDPVRLAEIDDVNDSFFTLRLVFKIKLNPEDTSIEDFDRVVVSILPTQQEKQESALLVNVGQKKNDSPSILNMVRNQRQGQNRNFTFNEQALRRLNERLETTANVLSRNQAQPAITSITSYIQPHIKNVKEKLIEFYELDVPQSINRLQETRILKNDILDKDDIFKDIMTNRLLPSQLFSKGSEDSIFKQKLADYFANDTQKPASEFLNTIIFYQPKKTLKVLTDVEIPLQIKVPIRYLESQLIAKFELYRKNSNIAEETENSTLELDRYVEAYYAVFADLEIEVSKKNLDNFTSISRDSFDSVDKKKIVGYNLYEKNINSNGNVSSFSFVATNNLLNDVLFDSVYRNINSATRLSVIRVTPVTPAGESNIFSDILVGETKSLKFSKELVYHLYQTGVNSLTLDLANIAKNIGNIKFYRRDCTNSIESTFELLKVFRRIKTSSFTIVDDNVIPGHFYEYYVEIYDNFQNLIQSSDQLLCEVKIYSGTKDTVSVSNLSVTNQEVSFSILTNYANSKNDLLERAVIESNQNLIASVASAAQRPVTDYKSIYFHKITRINTKTFSKSTFKFVSDGVFTDSPNASRLDNIEPLTLGTKYIYQIETFKRDPITVLSNFYYKGVNNNKEWFYKPFKWLNPSTVKRGILFNENDKSEINLQENEILSMDPIGAPKLLYVTIPQQSYNEILAVSASNISREVIKISWAGNDNKFDSFIVYKVVNGKKLYLGKTRTGYIYHRIQQEDLGTVYYEVTPILNDFLIEKTYFSNSLVIEDDISKRLMRL